MHARTKKLSVIGAALGLVLAASAITPAVAAPQPTAVTVSSCSALNGATATGSTVSFSSVPLKRGDSVTARITSAGSGDTISLFAASWLSFEGSEGPASGLTFSAGADGLYNLNYTAHTVTSADSATWSFSSSCSSTTVTPSPAPTKPGKGKGK